MGLTYRETGETAEMRDVLSRLVTETNTLKDMIEGANAAVEIIFDGIADILALIDLIEGKTDS